MFFTIVLECTGRYHEVMTNSLHYVGLFVYVVNSHLIKNSKFTIQKAFTECYRAFYKKHRYNFQHSNPEKLFNVSKELVAVHVEQLRTEMNPLASTLPEYETAININGVVILEHLLW